MDELEKLERHETIRILDLLFVGKDAETGDLLALDYQGEELGAIVGALLGFEFEDEQPSEDRRRIEGHAFGLSQREIQEHCGLAQARQLGRLPSHRARVGARSEGRDPRCGRLPAGGGFPHARDPRRSRYRARRHVRGPRGTRDRGGGRRGLEEAQEGRSNGEEGEGRWDLWQNEAAGRMQARQTYRTMARMQRRRSFVQSKARDEGGL